MTGALLESRRSDGIDYLWLNSPSNRNALSLGLLSELTEAVRASAAADESRGLVIGHRGPVFCAGVDLVERRQLSIGERNHSELLAECLDALWASPVPVICHVNGAARGGGMGLISCADVVVGGVSASFGYSEVRVGVAPALVGSLALAGGGGRALVPWLLSGRSFGPEIAERLGLVTEVAADDGVGAVESIVGDLLLGGPQAIRATKRLARRFGPPDMAAIIEEMNRWSADLFAGSEAQEGMTAFAEKRAPNWQVVSL